jgi:hypothetical protein
MSALGQKRTLRRVRAASALPLKADKIRNKCVAEKERLEFHVERRSDDLTIYLLIETWSDQDYFETVQLNRDYYPPYFVKISHDGCPS